MRGTTGRYAAILHRYDVTITTNIKTFSYTGIDRVRAAQMIRIIGDDWTIDVRHRISYYENEGVELCAGCRARPALFERDCDGWYSTVMCGMCRWNDAFALWDN